MARGQALKALLTRRRVLFAVIGALAAGYGVASLDWCGRWPDSEPRLVRLAAATGGYRAGASRVAIEPPYPVPVAGQHFPRPSASRAKSPIYARAVVVEVPPLRVAVVAIDLLTVPAPLSEAVSTRAVASGVGDVWVVATHPHSSMGGYDERLFSQIAGTGRYRPEALAAAAKAAGDAVEQAARALRPARLQVGSAEVALNLPRTGPEADRRLVRAVWRDDFGVVAQLVLYAAHPALEGASRELSADWPGAAAELLEKEGGVALVLQTAVGNASAADRPNSPRPYAERVVKAASGIGGEPTESGRLAFSRATVALPEPDGYRIAPAPFRRAAKNLLCHSAPREVDVSALQLGRLKLVGLPGEVTRSAALELQADAGGATVVSLVGDYIGYVESADMLLANDGESKYQYFGPELSERLRQGARAAAAVFQ